MNKALFNVALAATSFLSHAISITNDEQIMAAQTDFYSRELMER